MIRRQNLTVHQENCVIKQLSSVKADYNNLKEEFEALKIKLRETETLNDELKVMGQLWIITVTLNSQMSYSTFFD